MTKEQERIIEMFKDLAQEDVLAIVGMQRGKCTEEKQLHRNEKHAIDGKFAAFKSILVDVYQMPLNDVVNIYEGEFNRIASAIEEISGDKIHRC